MVVTLPLADIFRDNQPTKLQLQLLKLRWIPGLVSTGEGKSVHPEVFLVQQGLEDLDKTEVVVVVAVEVAMEVVAVEVEVVAIHKPGPALLLRTPFTTGQIVWYLIAKNSLFSQKWMS